MSVYKAFSQFVYPSLLQDGFYLKQQTKPQQKNQTGTAH